MKTASMPLVFALLLIAVQLLITAAEDDFVCYYTTGCADEETRPIFVLGSSYEECCGQPNIVSALQAQTEICSNCGPPSLVQLTPTYVVLSPPSPLVLELSATGYTAITWLLNGTDMHDFDRVDLENFSMRFILVNTSESDIGTYEADVHTQNGSVLTVYFFVQTFIAPTVQVSASDVDPQSGLVNLTCIATGNPLPVTTWQLMGTNVSATYAYITQGNFSHPPSQVSILEVTGDVTMDVYSCVASSEHDGITTTANANIALNGEPPQILSSSPPVVEVTNGMPEPAVLVCTAQGRPLPSITWLREEEEVRTEGLVSVTSEVIGDIVNSTLRIERVTFNDRGTHFCEVTNQEGQANVRIELVVRSPPNVTATPKRHQANIHEPGVRVMFTCTAIGNPSPMVGWTLNGQEIMDGRCDSEEVGEAGMDMDFGSSMDMGGIDNMDEDLTDVCQITYSIPTLIQAETGLTINDVNYFNTNVTVFTCNASNEVDNYINSPEADSVELVIVAVPYFIAPLNATHNVTVTEDLTLTCEVIGSGPPQVTWYRNGDSLSNGGRVSIENEVTGNSTTTSFLEIQSITLTDRGQYRCQAEDTDGVNATETTLDVKVPANITGPPQSVVVSIFGTATFTCTAEGFGLPVVSWGRLQNVDILNMNGNNNVTGGYELHYLGSNGENILITFPEANGTTGIITSVLEIYGVTEGDTGVYVCEVSNMVMVPSSLADSTIQSATAQLTFNTAPLLTELPTNATIPSTQTIQFRCSASGTPTPDIQWYKDGRLLNSTERIIISSQEFAPSTVLSVLEIQNTLSTDAGLYNCTAVNEAGSVGTRFHLTINTPPNITSPIPNTRITALFPTTLQTTLQCTSTGTPLPTITWRTENSDTEISCAEVSQIITDDVFPPPYFDLYERCTVIGSPGHSELIINNPRVEDSGNYVCVAENGILTTDDATVYLQVDVEPRAVVELITEEVEELEPFSLQCTALNQPTPIISWLKDNSLLTTAGFDTPERVSINENVRSDYLVVNTLTLQRAEAGVDDGKYQCRIDNANTTSVIFDSIEVNIMVKDECVLSGSSPCQNDGICVDELGGYRCECTTNFTGVNCTEPVAEKILPVITDPPVDVETVFLGEANLTCRAVGKPNPTYLWFKDGEFVFNTTEPFYSISEVQPSDRGQYNCIAMNSLGSSNVSSSGLLSIDGVSQYLATFIVDSCTDAFDFTDLVTQMSLCITGNQLVQGSVEIYSVTERPVRDPPSPIDQVVITVVANTGSNRQGIVQDLWGQLHMLNSKFGCTFTGLVRFDGCPEEKYALNPDFSVSVTWPESEIRDTKQKVCPCGELEAESYGSPLLKRHCEGTYSYGAEWGTVLNECNYNNNTYTLCNVTRLDQDQQAVGLARATQDAAVFTSLDFAIAGLIMQGLVDTENIVNETMYQTNFTRSFNNLLDTDSVSIVESQRNFQTASNLIDTLMTFGQRLDMSKLGLEGVALFEEDSFQLQVQEMALSTAEQSFTPDLSSSLVDFQSNAMELPLQGATITLPSELVDVLTPENPDQVLRFLNVIMETDSLFVVDSTTELGQDLENNTIIVGNLIISASIIGVGKVANLTESQSVIIRYTQTEGFNETNSTIPTCVFWETNTRSIFGNWSSRGCKLEGIMKGEIVCRCDHLSHFGMLMDINPRTPDSPGIGLSLQVITYVGCSLSIVCLLILLFTYLATKKLRTKMIGKLLLNTIVALIGVYGSFLLAMHGEYYADILGFCYTASALLQYFLLVYFLWTAIESFHICLKLVKIFGADIQNYILKTAIIAWGLPLLIVGLSAGLGIKYDMYVVKDDDDKVSFCRAGGIVFYAGILAPFILVYTFNGIIYLVIMISLSKQLLNKKKRETGDVKWRREYKKLAVVAFFLAIMFGLAWIFAIFVPIPIEALSITSQYLFSIFIAIQGLFYFILHGLRSPEARAAWVKLLFKGCPNKMSKYLPTIPSSSQHNPVQSPIAISGKPRHNPIYSPHDNVLSNPGADSKFNTLEPTKDMFDMGASPSAYSLASQTLKVDFPIPAQVSDDETSSMDMQELTDMINTKFTESTQPGFAYSPPHMLSHETTSPLHASITASPTQQPNQDELEFTLHEVEPSGPVGDGNEVKD